jgi:hypothetical protein
MLNRWTYTTELTLAANGAAGVAVNLLVNRPAGVLLTARTATPGVLNGAHRLKLYEGRTITNTMDPERGVHRARQFGDAMPDWLRLKLGMAVDDIFVFHSPDNFTDSGGGQLLYSRLGLSSAPAQSGAWTLTPGTAGRYYLIRVESAEALPIAVSLILEYQFVKP